jgi:hypothetical protein
MLKEKMYQKIGEYVLPHRLIREIFVQNLKDQKTIFKGTKLHKRINSETQGGLFSEISLSALDVAFSKAL